MAGEGDLLPEVFSRLMDKAHCAGCAAMSREEQNVYLISQLALEVIDGGLDGLIGEHGGQLRPADAR